jgi:hypothetical protein
MWTVQLTNGRKLPPWRPFIRKSKRRNLRYGQRFVLCSDSKKAKLKWESLCAVTPFEREPSVGWFTRRRPRIYNCKSHNHFPMQTKLGRLHAMIIFVDNWAYWLISANTTLYVSEFCSCRNTWEHGQKRWRERRRHAPYQYCKVQVLPSFVSSSKLIAWFIIFN